MYVNVACLKSSFTELFPTFSFVFVCTHRRALFLCWWHIWIYFYNVQRDVHLCSNNIIRIAFTYNLPFYYYYFSYWLWQTSVFVLHVPCLFRFSYQMQYVYVWQLRKVETKKRKNLVKILSLFHSHETTRINAQINEWYVQVKRKMCDILTTKQLAFIL